MGGPVYVRSERACVAPGGLEWTHDGAVVAVHDVEYAHALLRIAGFSEATPPPGQVTEPDPDAVAQDDEAARHKQHRAGRGKPVSETGK